MDNNGNDEDCRIYTVPCDEGCNLIKKLTKVQVKFVGLARVLEGAFRSLRLGVKSLFLCAVLGQDDNDIIKLCACMRVVPLDVQ